VKLTRMRRFVLVISPVVLILASVGLAQTNAARASLVSPESRIGGVTATATPVTTSTPTPTSPPEASVTPAPTASPAPTSTPAPTQTPAPTMTPVPTSSPVPTPTATAVPTPAAPTLVSIDPASGPVGTQVTLSGTNFSGLSAVNFGSAQSLQVNCIGSTICFAIAPPAASGSSVNVTVVTTAGTSNGLPFTYTGANGPVTGLPIPYFAGWNIVGGPTGTIVSGNMGPLYTWQAGFTAYQVLPSGSPLTQPLGYWAFFPVPTSSAIPVGVPLTLTVGLPPGQWIMIGNPGNTPATVTRADVVYIWDGVQYQVATSLNPGQGGWAISVVGSAVTISNR
jgi:IPT/TIG domain